MLAGCGSSGNTSGAADTAPAESKTEAVEGTGTQAAEESAPADTSSVNATGTVYDLGGLKLPICDPGSVTLTYMGNDTWCAGVSYNDGTAVQKKTVPAFILNGIRTAVMWKPFFRPGWHPWRGCLTWWKFHPLIPM